MLFYLLNDKTFWVLVLSRPLRKLPRNDPTHLSPKLRENFHFPDLQIVGAPAPWVRLITPWAQLYSAGGVHGPISYHGNSLVVRAFLSPHVVQFQWDG